MITALSLASLLVSAAPLHAEALPPQNVPRHPFMAATDSNNMHGDSFATDTHATRGPVSPLATVESF